MNRYLVGYILGIGLLLLLFTSNNVLLNTLKRNISTTNKDSEDKFSFKPITISSVILLTVLFWVLPVIAPNTDLKLEYSLILLFIYWALLLIITRWAILKKTSKSISKRALPILFLISFCAGLALIPIFITIRSIFW